MMNKSRSLVSAYLLRLLHVLIVLGMAFAPGTSRVLAQEANPPPLPSTPTALIDYEAVVEPSADAASSAPEAIPAAESPVDSEGAASGVSESEVGDEVNAVEEQPAPSTIVPHSEQIATQNTNAHVMQVNGPNAPEVQGVVQLDITVPDTTMAGQTLTYTYRYSNTSAASVSNIVVDASWSNFIGGAQQQKCYDVGCPAILSIGPSVITNTPPATANMRYVIGTLAANQSGQFSVIMRVDSADYPKTGQPIARPAGSGKLYRDNNYGTVVSDDTANTMIVGPVLVLTKTATSAVPIYTGESAEFNIRLGNASAAGDQVGGSLRADARQATDVLLQDFYPQGSALVSATGPYISDDIAGLITWTFPSLATGAFQDLKVVFRKIDSEDDCTKLDNNNYEGTSNEYPFQSATKRYTVRGTGVSVPVVPPLQTPFITPTVSTLYYGNETIITITVRNHYTAALTGVVMKYVLPENLGYVGLITGSALISTPVSTYGGEVGWRFDMPAATTKTIPSSKLFAIRVRAAFLSVNYRGAASIVNSGSIKLPIMCAFKAGGPDVKPRIKAVKSTDLLDRKSIYENAYYVTRDEDFPFVITITNRSMVTVTGLTITDTLPGKTGEPDANLSYISGSGTLNGAMREPDVVLNGYAGKLIWNNLTIPANSYIVLRYLVNVDGRDYYRYCNTIAVGFGTTEDAEYGNSGEKGICVKINPDVRMYKAAYRTVAGPGEEVPFLLSLTNYENVPYVAGLHDKLNEFTFVRQISGYAEPYSVTSPAKGMKWPLVTLNPGDVISAVIVARMPDTNCAQTKYDNEVEFNMISEGVETHYVRIIPFKVPVQCAAIEIRKTADRTNVSLRDLMTFTLSIKNINPSDAVTNVQAIDVLPPGFSYVAMSPASDLSIVPVQSVRADGRAELTWNLGTIAGGQTRNLRVWARSSDTVGSFENWLSQASAVSTRCLSSCRVVTETNGTRMTYHYAPVVVLPLNTIAPQVLETTCARPNDTRTYRLTMVNTNVHSYENITITVALPMGLRFSRAISNTTAPQVINETDGVQTVRWVNQRINAKPQNVFAAQVEYWMELSVGNVLGDLPTIATATSPDGLIPRKDEVSDPAVLMCAPGVATVVKAVNVPQVRVGQEVVYQITLMNPTGSPISTNVSDPLPGNFGFVGMLSGPDPIVSGNTLTWLNVNVPANDVVKLVFRVAADGPVDVTYTNIAQTSAGLESVNALADVFLAAPLANLTGVVFNDANDNGVRDGTENGIANATVTLTLSSGSVVTQTNAQGVYGFYDLIAGAFTVQVAPRPNLIHTSPNAVIGTLNANVTTVVDFGFGTLPSLSIADVVVDEGTGTTTNMVFVVALSKLVPVPVTVRVSTASGSASASSDYTAIDTFFTIPASTSSIQVEVTVSGDFDNEPDETLLVNLSSPTNATILDGQGRGTIVNDDEEAKPLTVFIYDAGIGEGNSGTSDMRFLVRLPFFDGVPFPVTVTYATRSGTGQAGSDFTTVQGTAVIPPGALGSFISVPIVGDTTVEQDEVFFMDLISATNAVITRSTAIGTIVNDDGVLITPTLMISDVSIGEGNVGPHIVQVPVSLDRLSPKNVSIQYSTVQGTAQASIDYTPVVLRGFTMTPGERTINLPIEIWGETEYEPNETIQVCLTATNVNLPKTCGTLTILNDDLPSGLSPRAYLPMVRK